MLFCFSNHPAEPRTVQRRFKALAKNGHVDDNPVFKRRIVEKCTAPCAGCILDGVVNQIIMRIVDMFMTVPAILYPWPW